MGWLIGLSIVGGLALVNYFAKAKSPAAIDQVISRYEAGDLNTDRDSLYRALLLASEIGDKEREKTLRRLIQTGRAGDR